MPRMWDRESRSYKWIEPTARQKRDKILANIVKIGYGKCWEWTGSTTGFGYGVVYWEGKQRIAHRLSFEAWKKIIPEGMLVCHKCDNPKCVNPSHLFLGTHQDNAADRNGKGRQAQGERHGRWKGGRSYNYVARTVPPEEREAMKAARKRERQKEKREAKAREVIARVESRRKAG